VNQEEDGRWMELIHQDCVQRQGFGISGGEFLGCAYLEPDLNI
jgi:hypothetical protein